MGKAGHEEALSIACLLRRSIEGACGSGPRDGWAADVESEKGAPCLCPLTHTLPCTLPFPPLHPTEPHHTPTSTYPVPTHYSASSLHPTPFSRLIPSQRALSPSLSPRPRTPFIYPVPLFSFHPHVLPSQPRFSDSPQTLLFPLAFAALPCRDSPCHSAEARLRLVSRCIGKDTLWSARAKVQCEHRGDAEDHERRLCMGVGRR